jgi:hypothetical protein
VLAEDITYSSGFERIAYCCANPAALVNPSGAISSPSHGRGVVSLTHLNKAGVNNIISYPA